MDATEGARVRAVRVALARPRHFLRPRSTVPSTRSPRTAETERKKDVSVNLWGVATRSDVRY